MRREQKRQRRELAAQPTSADHASESGRSLPPKAAASRAGRTWEAGWQALELCTLFLSHLHAQCFVCVFISFLPSRSLGAPVPYQVCACARPVVSAAQAGRALQRARGSDEGVSRKQDAKASTRRVDLCDVHDHWHMSLVMTGSSAWSAWSEAQSANLSTSMLSLPVLARNRVRSSKAGTSDERLVTSSSSSWYPAAWQERLTCFTTEQIQARFRHVPNSIQRVAAKSANDPTRSIAGLCKISSYPSVPICCIPVA